MRDSELHSIALGPKGDFEIPRVLPGSYKLTGVQGDQLQGSIPLEVGAQDIDDLRLPLTPGAEVKGTIEVDGDAGPAAISRGRVVIVNGRRRGRMVEAAEGSFVAKNLFPGRYTVNWTPQLPVGYYTKSIRSGNIDVREDGLTVAAEQTIPVAIVFGSDGCRVEGIVLDKDGKPVPGATVVLEPRTELRTATDRNGAFSIPTVAPGDYQLFAWDDVENDAWDDPDFMKDFEGKAQRITVRVKKRAFPRLSPFTGQ